MIRITGGKYRGHKILSAIGRTRPTSARVRQALFDILGDISGLSFADLYAGSGVVGIEAISRGASTVEFIEFNPKMAEAITQSIRRLDISGERTRVRKARVNSWASSSTEKFNIIFADPPYMKCVVEEFENILPEILARLSDGGILILQLSNKIEITEIYTDKREFGDDVLYFWEKDLDD